MEWLFIDHQEIVVVLFINAGMNGETRVLSWNNQSILSIAYNIERFTLFSSELIRLFSIFLLLFLSKSSNQFRVLVSILFHSSSFLIPSPLQEFIQIQESRLFHSSPHKFLNSHQNTTSFSPAIIPPFSVEQWWCSFSPMTYKNERIENSYYFQKGPYFIFQ